MSLALRKGKPARKSDVWMRQSDKENVVFDPETEVVHMLNTTAMAIWVLCDGDTDPDEMVDAVCELSGLPREVVEEDVGGILTEFEDAGHPGLDRVAMPLLKPMARADLLVVELDGEAVIYDEDSTDLHLLNPTATVVFGMCDGTSTMQEISAEIADAFDVPIDQVEPEVRTLVRSCVERSSWPTSLTVRKVRPRNREFRSFLPYARPLDERCDVTDLGPEISPAGPPGWPGRIVARVRRDVPLVLLDGLVVVPAYLIPLVLRFHGSVPWVNWRYFLFLLPLIVIDPPLVQLPVRALRADVALRERAGGAERRHGGGGESGRGRRPGRARRPTGTGRSRSRWSCWAARRRSWSRARSGSRAACSRSGGARSRTSNGPACS